MMLPAALTRTRAAARNGCEEGIQEHLRNISGAPASDKNVDGISAVSSAYCETFGRDHLISTYGSVGGFVATFDPPRRAAAKKACEEGLLRFDG